MSNTIPTTVYSLQWLVKCSVGCIAERAEAMCDGTELFDRDSAQTPASGGSSQPPADSRTGRCRPRTRVPRRSEVSASHSQVEDIPRTRLPLQPRRSSGESLRRSRLRDTVVERRSLWPANFPRPALDMLLMGDHCCG